ncbi:hypothetical protein AVEN_84492-1, partial [Araneus ventricosus]
RLFLLASLKSGLFERKRHKLNSPNLHVHLSHHPAPCYNLLLRSAEMNCGGQGKLDPLLHLSPKRSQNVTFPQKKPTASDWPSVLLRGNF